MSTSKDRETRRNPARRTKPARLRPSGNTGLEAKSLRSLVDSRSPVVVTLTTGEQLRGRIRYYDRDCFSFRVTESGQKLFLRKKSVLGIQEE